MAASIGARGAARIATARCENSPRRRWIAIDERPVCVASAVGEGSMAIQFVHEYLEEL